jgi:hypothetical protein
MITEYDTQVAHQRRALTLAFAVTFLCLGVLAYIYTARRQAYGRVVERRLQLRGELQSVAEQHQYRPLEKFLADETGRTEALSQEWEKMRYKVDTFRGSSPLVEALSPDAEGRIDFKIALYEARDRLQELADEKSVDLPARLGLDETIDEEEAIDTRIWQLASVVRLVESCIANGVQKVEALEILPPVVYPLLEEEQSVAVEYPVRIALHCRFDALLRLLAHMDSAGSFFAVRECKLALLSASEDRPLRVTLVAGAVNFQWRGESDAVISAQGALSDE